MILVSGVSCSGKDLCVECSEVLLLEGSNQFVDFKGLPSSSESSSVFFFRLLGVSCPSCIWEKERAASLFVDILGVSKPGGGASCDKKEFDSSRSRCIRCFFSFFLLDAKGERMEINASELYCIFQLLRA